jgi:SAM-dependent methyltransferase
MPATTPAPDATGYGRRYLAGGFGYEAQRRYLRRWLRRHYVRAFGFPRGGRVLDVPCGDGFWTSLLHGEGFDAVGIDRDPGGVTVARRRYPGIDFHVGDAEQPLPVTGTFDVVFSRGISHLHRETLIDDSSIRMVRNLMSYVAAGGLLLLSYHTRRDGSRTKSHSHHAVGPLVTLAEHAGDVTRVEVVNDFVQIAVEHRTGPRRDGRRLVTKALDRLAFERDRRQA